MYIYQIEKNLKDLYVQKRKKNAETNNEKEFIDSDVFI